MDAWASAAEIAAAVAAGKTNAPSRSWKRRCARIAERDKALNAFTAVTRERALAKARAIDAGRASGAAARAARRRAVRGQEPVRRGRARPRWPAPRSTATGRRPRPTPR